MTVAPCETADHAMASLRHSPSCWDPETECDVVFAHPAIERELWRDFVRGAERSYTKRGVEKALDMPALHSGADTILFAACVDRAGRVVGGLRAKGPYQSADEAHALLEWEGQPGFDAVRKMISDRLPFGVVEMKTAWVTDDPERSRQLTSAISRTPLHAMGMLDIQFIVATAASYVLKRWLSSGGILATKIPPTPYPDERYETRLAWWDRLTFAKHADPKQLSLYFAEQQRMTPRPGGAARVAAATGTDR
ncbi:hypothetical protein SAMN04489835_5260 [Mycolicibacterium rutilum]|uniref:N-acetyltransferase domain-containing protein n=1 Tax=Mycolicibacterium rutilum TaxID=370526 RepID=A0A1H6LIM9_MYCRU|nr:hypothetical protein [Mycolicibacterium rutilum]SEH88399.1 hypothetical protein SAMN04489835_5260 [Mycolicibacterium rutilum]